MKKFLLAMGILVILLPVTVIAVIPQDDLFNQVNQKVCDRFEVDLTKLAAIMEELRRRKGITETRVAFGGVDNPIENADYWVTYAAEALAFERAQKYSSKSSLKGNLEGLKDKILKVKNEVRKALDE